MGYTNGSTTSFQLPGALVNGALIDGGPNSLVGHSLNSDVLGRYDFPVRNGEVIGAVPEPATFAFLGLGLLEWVDPAVPGSALISRVITFLHCERPAVRGPFFRVVQATRHNRSGSR